jgi:hypothetical protein
VFECEVAFELQWKNINSIGVLDSSKNDIDKQKSLDLVRYISRRKYWNLNYCANVNLQVNINHWICYHDHC